MPNLFIAVADGNRVPRFPFNELLTSCEEAVDFLENVAVDELWITADDLTSADGTESLIDFLLMEEGWEGKSQVGGIYVYAKTIGEAQPMMDRLRDHYLVAFRPLTDELFEQVAA